MIKSCENLIEIRELIKIILYNDLTIDITYFHLTSNDVSELITTKLIVNLHYYICH